MEHVVELGLGQVAIGRDTHRGPWSIANPAHEVRMRAGDVAADHPDGVMWVFMGHLDWDLRIRLFSYSRYAADTIGGLRIFDSSGRHICTYPANRVLTIAVEVGTGG